MPQSFYLCPLFKKGDRTDCGNYRGISLLTSAGKILARILANRLLPVSEDTLPESQNGFRPSRGTVDMIFTARQLQEKCREQNQPLYMAFIDLAKAFDTVNRSALWTILQKIGCPDKFVNILRLLHDDMMATVLDSNGSQSDPFKVESGVKQGCVIAPTLFSIFIAMILHLVDGKLPTGVEIIYRTDGKLLNLSRLRAKTKVTTKSVIELQYADDNVVCAHSEEDLQATLNSFTEAYEKLGLSLNIEKTKVLFQQAPANPSAKPGIQLNGVTLENVDHFRYLGSHLSTKVNIDTEIQHRLSSASAAFFRMKQRVFDDRDIRRETKVLVYKAIVLPTLLYACKTWTVYRRHTKLLERFHQRCLRKILQISWEDRRTNVSVLEEAKTTSTEAILLRHQLRWTGHVVRMPDHRLPKQLLYSELKNGKRNVGGQEKRFKYGLKANLKNCGIDTENWEALALERSNWRSAVTSSAVEFEEARTEGLREKRAKRKERQANPDRDRLPPGNRCPHCGRICGSRIGLFSHLRTHAQDTKVGRLSSSNDEGSPK
uniref:ribonuclease H n=1 Tax=Anolis carolinensis TaxID=28377 RepID=A0A803TM72_ANOCA